MKFHLNHDLANKTITIPRAALQFSGLADVSDLILHTDSGCVLLLPGDPTVAELLKTISLISAVAPQLISRLAERSQMAMEAGMTETACGACERKPQCSGLEIPPCQLAEAGDLAHCRAGVLCRGGQSHRAGSNENRHGCAHRRAGR